MQIGLLVGLLSLPMSITPSLLVWSYDYLLWTSERLWVGLEAVGVVMVSTALSRYLVSKADEQPTLAKVKFSTQNRKVFEQ